MIKPESNAPSQMQPWIRTTDRQIEELERSIAKLQSLLAGSLGTDHEQNFALNNVFSFTRFDDGSVSTNANGMRFLGDVVADTGVDVAGVLTVGNPTREIFSDEGESVGTIPNFEVAAGSYEINPVTGAGDYTAGTLHMNDTSVDMNVYGGINGDGLSIVLSNEAQLARENVEVLAVSGDGEFASYEIEKTDDTLATYVAGRYVTVSGIDPDGYNVEKSIILEVDSSGSNLVFDLASDVTDAYVAGGYVTISEANSIYEGKVSVRGPGPDYFGATVNQQGLFVGEDGGNPAIAATYITPGVVSAPEVSASYLKVDGTKVFVTSVEPSAPADGDLWVDPAGSPLGGVAAPHAATHGVAGSDPVTLAQSQIVNLTTDLAGKANTVHTHAISDVTGLQTALDSKVVATSEDVSSGIISSASGWGSSTVTYLERNGVVQINLRATRTGASLSAGNITNVLVQTISSGYRPALETLAGGGPTGPVIGAYINTSGGVYLTALGSGIATGDSIDINATYIKA